MAMIVAITVAVITAIIITFTIFSAFLLATMKLPKAVKRIFGKTKNGQNDIDQTEALDKNSKIQENDEFKKNSVEIFTKEKSSKTVDDLADEINVKVAIENEKLVENDESASKSAQKNDHMLSKNSKIQSKSEKSLFENSEINSENSGISSTSVNLIKIEKSVSKSTKSDKIDPKNTGSLLESAKFDSADSVISSKSYTNENLLKNVDNSDSKSAKIKSKSIEIATAITENFSANTENSSLNSKTTKKPENLSIDSKITKNSENSSVDLNITKYSENSSKHSKFTQNSENSSIDSKTTKNSENLSIDSKINKSSLNTSIDSKITQNSETSSIDYKTTKNSEKSSADSKITKNSEKLSVDSNITKYSENSLKHSKFTQNSEYSSIDSKTTKNSENLSINSKINKSSLNTSIDSKITPNSETSSIDYKTTKNSEKASADSQITKNSEKSSVDSNITNYSQISSKHSKFTQNFEYSSIDSKTTKNSENPSIDSQITQNSVDSSKSVESSSADAKASGISLEKAENSENSSKNVPPTSTEIAKQFLEYLYMSDEEIAKNSENARKAENAKKIFEILSKNKNFRTSDENNSKNYETENNFENPSKAEFYINKNGESARNIVENSLEEKTDDDSESESEISSLSSISEGSDSEDDDYFLDSDWIKNLTIGSKAPMRNEKRTEPVQPYNINQRHGGLQRTSSKEDLELLMEYIMSDSTSGNLQTDVNSPAERLIEIILELERDLPFISNMLDPNPMSSIVPNGIQNSSIMVPNNSNPTEMENLSSDPSVAPPNGNHFSPIPSTSVNGTQNNHSNYQNTFTMAESLVGVMGPSTSSSVPLPNGNQSSQIPSTSVNGAQNHQPFTINNSCLAQNDLNSTGIGYQSSSSLDTSPNGNHFSPIPPTRVNGAQNHQPFTETNSCLAQNDFNSTGIGYQSSSSLDTSPNGNHSSPIPPTRVNGAQNHQPFTNNYSCLAQNDLNSTGIGYQSSSSLDISPNGNHSSPIPSTSVNGAQNHQPFTNNYSCLAQNDLNSTGIGYQSSSSLDTSPNGNHPSQIPSTSINGTQNHQSNFQTTSSVTQNDMDQTRFIQRLTSSVSLPIGNNSSPISSVNVIGNQNTSSPNGNDSSLSFSEITIDSPLNHHWTPLEFDDNLLTIFSPIAPLLQDHMSDSTNETSVNYTSTMDICTSVGVNIQEPFPVGNIFSNTSNQMETEVQYQPNYNSNGIVNPTSQYQMPYNSNMANSAPNSTVEDFNQQNQMLLQPNGNQLNVSACFHSNANSNGNFGTLPMPLVPERQPLYGQTSSNISGNNLNLLEVSGGYSSNIDMVPEVPRSRQNTYLDRNSESSSSSFNSNGTYLDTSPSTSRSSPETVVRRNRVKLSLQEISRPSYMETLSARKQLDSWADNHCAKRLSQNYKLTDKILVMCAKYLEKPNMTTESKNEILKIVEPIYFSHYVCWKPEHFEKINPKGLNILQKILTDLKKSNNEIYLQEFKEALQILEKFDAVIISRVLKHGPGISHYIQLCKEDHRKIAFEHLKILVVKNNI